MLRFIFVCIGVVALSVIAISAQFITDGISSEAKNVLARNTAAENTTQAIASEDTPSADSLNQIDTAAGTPSFDPNDTFSGPFTNIAPDALAERETPVAAQQPATATPSAD